MASLGYLSEKKNGDSLNFALPGNSFDYAMFINFFRIVLIALRKLTAEMNFRSQASLVSPLGLAQDGMLSSILISQSSSMKRSIFSFFWSRKNVL